MAQTWTATLLAQSGAPQPTYSSTTGINPSGVILCSCVGPATSVSDGSTLDLSDWLASKCYGGRILGVRGTHNPDFVHQVKPGSSWTSSALKIITKRTSTGNKISAAVALNGEKLVIEFVGY
jgi:hypothetical protein